MAITDLSVDFASAGLDGVLRAGSRPALVLVDPARAYTEPSSPLYAGVEEPVAQMRLLLAAARASATPVFITRVVHEFIGDGGLFARKIPATRCFEAGNPFGDPIEGLEHRDGETLVTKQYPSAFFGTSLAASLTAQRIDTVVLAGLSTSGCIRASALDALQNGFVPIVVREAVGDRHAEVNESNLRDIQAKIGEVVTMRQATEYLAVPDAGIVS